MQKVFLLAIAVLSTTIVYADDFTAAGPKALKVDSQELPQIDSAKWDFSADALYWRLEETGTDWTALLGLMSPLENAKIHFDFKPLSFHWNWGLRVGAGRKMEYDQWDTQLYYTWFRTKSKDHVVSEGLEGATPLYPSAFLLAALHFVDPLALAKSGQVHWSALFNIFDWELGRNFSISHNLTLHPYLGLKGGWIHQKIDMNWLYFGEYVNITAVENFANNFWGVGPKAGLDSEWNLGNINRHSFSIFGDFAGAFLGGYWTFRDVYKTSSNATSYVNLDKKGSGALMLQGLMGFGWDASYGKNHISARLGYEMQFWFDQLQIFTLVQGRLFNDLSLQGGTFNVRFDF